MIPACALIGACVVGAGRASGNRRTLLFGTATGVAFGMCAPLTKAAVSVGTRDFVAMLASWQSWMLVAAGVGGFYLQQLAFQSGALSASLPALTVTEPLVAGLCGAEIFEERLQVGGAGWALVAGCVLVMIAATIGLARSQAASG